MKRGEIWWVNLASSVGGEIQKRRPAVIVSNDSANRHLNRVQLIPLTRSTSKLYPCEAYVTIGKRKNKAMADQLTTANKQRLSNRIGKVEDQEMLEIERAIRVQLDLP